MADESRVDEIVGRWRERRDRGERVDPADVIAAHPELADTLRARFAALAVLDATLARPAPLTVSKLRAVHEDRYADFRVLGAGGMGIVYWALDTDLNRQVAFKVVRPDTGEPGSPAPSQPQDLVPPAEGTPASEAFRTLKVRFLQEAWVTAGLEHPGIVPVYEVGRTDEGVPYYTMRFVRGSRTFAAAIEAARGRPFDERLALLEPFLKVCDTIRYAHAHGVIHRDLKPDNVALGEFGEVVVLDWGLAKMTDAPDAAGDTWRRRIAEFRDASDLRTVASALGTPGYMSPEAAMGRSAEVDARSDVYSLGAILYQVLAGRLPYQFSNYGELLQELMKGTPPEPSTFDPAIPPELSQLCIRALAKNREARPASADALATEIREWQRRRERDAQVRALVAEADAAREGLEAETGDALLARAQRLRSLCERIVALEPGHPRAAALTADADASKERAIAERERAARSRALRRAAAAALVFLVVAGAVVAKALDDRRRQAEDAQRQTAVERDAKQAAFERAEGLRLAALAKEKLAADPDLALTLATLGASRHLSSITLAPVAAAYAEARCVVRYDPGADSIASASMSSDGRYVLGGGESDTGAGWVEHVWDAATGVETACLWWCEREAAFTGDGRFVLVRQTDGLPVRVCDPATGRTLRTIRAAGGTQVWGAVPRPRASTFLLHEEPTAARELVLWDAATGAEVRRYAITDCSDASWSDDGARFLARGESRDVVFDAETGTALATFAKSEGVAALVLSRDGEYVACSETAGPPSVRRVRDGAVVCRIGERPGEPSFVAFDRSSRRVLVLAELNGRLALHAVDTGRVIWRSPEDEGYLEPAFSEDGRLVAYEHESKVRVWDVDAGVAVADVAGFAGPNVSITSIRFVGDGRRLLVANVEAVRLCSVDAPTRVAATDFRGEGAPDAGALSPDGALAATTGDTEQVVRVWDAATGAETASWPSENVQWLRFAGDRVVGVGRDAGVRVWDAATGAKLLDVEGRGDWASEGAVSWFDADAREAWVPMKRVDQATTRTLRRVDLRTGAETRRAEFAGGEIRFIARSPDGRRLAVGLDSDAAVLIDTADAREIGRLAGHETGAIGGAFSADGRRLVTWSREGTIRLWDAESGVASGALRGGAERLDGVRYDGAVTRAAALDAAGAIRVWDLAAARVVATIPAPAAATRALRMSRDGRVVVTAHADGVTRVWNADDGSLLSACVGHGADVEGAWMSADGTRVLTASSDGSARTWDPRTGRQAAEFRGHRGDTLGGMGLSADGRRMFVLSGRGVARVFDTSDWRVLRRLPSTIREGVLSPDGRRVAAVGADLAIRLWDVDEPARDRVVGRTDAASEWLLGRPVQESPVLAFDSASARLAAWCATNVLVFDTSDGRVLATSPELGRRPQRLWFSQDGASVLVHRDDGRVTVLEAASGRVLRTFGEASPSGWSSVIPSPDGRRVVTYWRDPPLLWDATTGVRVPWRPDAPATPNEIRATRDDVSFDTASRRVAVHGGGALHVFDAASGTRLETLRAGNVRDSAFSPDGNRLVAADDETLQVWDLRTPGLVTAWPVYSHGCLASPDSGTLYVATPEGVVVLPADVLATAKARPRREITADERDAFEIGTEAERAEIRSRPLAQARRAVAEIVVREGDPAKAQALVRERTDLSAAAKGEALRILDGFPAADADALRRWATDQLWLWRQPTRRYRTGLAWARAALALAPGDIETRRLVGMGQYRVEDYDGAVLTLTACDREQAASADGADAADVAFLAMSYFHLGREEDARRELARLREVAKSPRSVAQKYAAYYVDDAVETIEGPPRLDGR